MSEDERFVSRVVCAIQRVCSTRCYVIGSACGRTYDQLLFLDSYPHFSDRVKVLFDQLALELGRKPAAEKMLEACRSISNPTYNGVLEEMEK